jgi:hypothetical protein
MIAGIWDSRLVVQQQSCDKHRESARKKKVISCGHNQTDEQTLNELGKSGLNIAQCCSVC